jgi:hypothetical protein
MFKLSNLNKPTPKFWKRLGNALFAVSTGCTIPAILTDNQVLAYIIFGLGALGKFITSLTSDE